MNKITKAMITGIGTIGLFMGVGTVANAQHSVVKGETLSSIATKYDVSLFDVVKWNPQLNDINLIFPNQKINVHSYESNNNVTQSVQTEKKETVYQQPVQRVVHKVQPQQNVEKKVSTNVNYVQQPKQVPQKVTHSSSEESAKRWIAYKESTNNYNAVSKSGTYVGKYQLTRSYLNGDTSPANQERVADKYVKERYGSWVNAQRAWQQKGWY